MYFIAEIGVNHNGDAALAEKLIVEAKNSGADAVKFQHFDPQNLAHRETEKVGYQKRTSDRSETHFEMLRKLAITKEIEDVALNCSRKLGLDFISTPYDPDSALHLIQIGVDKIKVASADIVDHRLHKIISSENIPSIVATGMASYDEISEVMEIYKKGNCDVSLLHCVSSYPCSFESLNLRVIPELANKFSVEVGFSDHSIDYQAACVALTLGASIFEKHFTLDKSLPGPDHLASSTPEEFKLMVDRVKNTELILGNKNKKLQDEEESMYKISRKSVVAKLELPAGTILTEDNITMLRPGEGLSGKDYFKIIGKKLKRGLNEGEKIIWEDVS